MSGLTHSQVTFAPGGRWSPSVWRPHIDRQFAPDLPPILTMT